MMEVLDVEVILLEPLEPWAVAACRGVYLLAPKIEKSLPWADAFVVCAMRLRFNQMVAQFGVTAGAIVRRGVQYDLWVHGCGYPYRMTILTDQDGNAARLVGVQLDEVGQPGAG